MAKNLHEIKVPVKTFGTGLFCFLCRVLPELGLSRNCVGKIASSVVFVQFKFPWGSKWDWGPRFLDLDKDKS